MNSINYYEDVWQKAINLVIPSYALTSSCSSEKSTLTGNATDMIGIIEKYLKEIFIQTIMTAEKEDVSVYNTQSGKWPLNISTLPVFSSLVIS